MTIDVSKTRELANRIQDELPKLWHKRFLGPGKILSLCILLVGVMVHLQQLAEGLTILARQMQVPEHQRTEELKEESLE